MKGQCVLKPSSGDKIKIPYVKERGEVHLLSSAPGCCPKLPPLRAYGSLVLPDKIEGCPVTSLGRNTLWVCNRLVSITLPKGLRNIDGCPPYDHYRCGHAFRECYYLTEILVDAENPWFTSKDGVLYSKDGKTLLVVPPGYSKRDFVVPEGVTKIGAYAFCECCGICDSVTFPESLQEIGDSAFLECRPKRAYFKGGVPKGYEARVSGLFSEPHTLEAYAAEWEAFMAQEEAYEQYLRDLREEE